jgi:uncharacterized protein
MFVGRTTELGRLEALLDTVRRGGRADAGVAVLLRGRRRMGKSRLVEEFVRRSGCPSVHFQAARGAAPGEELQEFAAAIAGSDLPDALRAEGNVPVTLTAALQLLEAALPADQPSIVVIDEAPWLLESIDGGAGQLQRVWDRSLSRKPVLLVLVGSDLAAMEQLSGPDRPFHGRATEMVLDPLSPADVGRMCGLDAFDAFDAYLITGGQPLVAQEWPKGVSPFDFVRQSFESSTSALVVSGSRVLDAEFRDAAMARRVLTAVGGRGERTFSGIQGAPGAQPMNANTLSAALQALQAKRVLAADEPLSVRRAAKDRRWRVEDPALRFWLAFVAPALDEIDRGRGDLATARVAAGFDAWRGRAIEPVVRASLERLLPDERWPDARAVGAWWPRTNVPEVDLVGADARPAERVTFVGTVKWRRDRPLDRDDLDVLARDAVAVPGVHVGTPLVGVCPGGRVRGVPFTKVWTAKDLLAAWR